MCRSVAGRTATTPSPRRITTIARMSTDIMSTSIYITIVADAATGPPPPPTALSAFTPVRFLAWHHTNVICTRSSVLPAIRPIDCSRSSCIPADVYY